MNNFTYRFSNYQESGNTYGIFTGMFLHGNFWHLFSNLIFLYPFTLITSSVVKNYIFGGVILIT
jgi:membrane associated rhomboid family serine protease